MAAKKQLTKAGLRKEMKKLVEVGEYEDRDPTLTAKGDAALDTVKDLAARSSEKNFVAVCEELGVLGRTTGAAVMRFLLAAGVDPNALSKGKYRPGTWPLHRVVEDASWLRDRLKGGLVELVEILLEGGAPTDALWPPPPTQMNTLRATPLDYAVKAQDQAIVDVLLPRCSEPTKVGALVFALVECDGKKPDSPKVAFATKLIEQLPVDGTGDKGLSPLHAAVISGHQSLYDAVAARAEEKNPTLAEGVSFVSYSYPSGPKGGVIPSARFAEGSTPLDLITPIQGVLRGGLAKYEAEREANGGTLQAFHQSQLEQIEARLAAYDAMKAKLAKDGATSKAKAATLSGPLGVVQAQVLRLAEAAGTEEKVAALLAGIDVSNRGPLGLLLAAADVAAAELLKGKVQQNLGAHRLGLFLDGGLKKPLAIYGPEATSHPPDSIWAPPPDAVLIWPESYPDEARRILEFAILGLDGETVIGATKEEHGTVLWAITEEEVTSLGEMTEFVRQGVDAILGEAKPEATGTTESTESKLEETNVAGALEGKRVCVAGRMKLKKKEVTAKLEAAGATVTGSISKKLDYLFAGSRAGAKLEEAKKLGVTVVDEEGMLALLAAGEPESEAAGSTATRSAKGSTKAPEPAKTTAPKKPSGPPLAGKRAVLTGEFPPLSRSEVKRQLEALGARVTGSVSGKTDVLFVGDDAGASKLGKATSLGTPTLDQAGLKRILEGVPLEDVVAAPPEPAGADERTPMPRVFDRPHDGEFRYLYPGTEQTKCVGSYVAARKHGTWRWHWQSGHESCVVDHVDGPRHGKEVLYHENGQKNGEGENRDGHRVGAWDFWHPNGAWMQRYYYDDAGEKHGEYVWDADDGTPRARGRYWHGKRDGRWTWYATKTHEKVERGYDRQGRQHGPEQALFPGGQLAYRRDWDHGRKIGVHETWDAEGNPLTRETYDARGVLQEKRTWEGGEETVVAYVDGLRESIASDEKLLQRVAAKVAKAKDQYAKRDAIRDACEYGEEVPLLLHLWRAGHVDLSKEPDLWEMLSYADEHFTGAEVMTLLRGLKPSKDTYCGLVAKWPTYVDRLLTRIYARDPEAIDAAWEDLPPKVRRGVAFVLARFGVDIGSEAAALAKLLAKRSAREYLDSRVCWPTKTDEGWVVEEKTLDWTEPSFEEPGAVEELLQLFTTLEDFGELQLRFALERVAKQKHEDVYLDKLGYAVRVANEEQLGTLVRRASLGAKPVEKALLVLRSDPPERLERIALSIEKNGLRKWPAVCCAILRHHEVHGSIPEALLDALELDQGTPSISWVGQRLQKLPNDSRHDAGFIDATLDFASDPERGEEPFFEDTTLLYQTLRALDEGQRRAVIERQLESQYGKVVVAAYLHLVEDAALWERAIDVIAEDKYGGGHAGAIGLGHLPAQALPLLAAGKKKATTGETRAVFARAVVHVLARMASRGEAWDARWDEWITMSPEHRDYDYSYVMPLLQKVIHRLPRERAEKVLLRGLTTKNVRWFARAFRFVPCHQTEAVMHAAFGGLLEVETKIKGGDEHHVEAGLRGIGDRSEWVKWLLRNGGGAKLGQQLANAVGGQKQYEELKKSLESEGVETAKELGPIEMLQKLASEALGGKKGQPIYALRRLPKKPASPGLNQIGGIPAGIVEWPTNGDDVMTHMFTLDLDTMPELKAMLGEFRTLSLFVANPELNEAYSPDNGETEVVLLTDEEREQESVVPEDAPTIGEAWFEPVRVEVPPSVWFGSTELKKQIYRMGARVLGPPQWLQGEEGGGGAFVMQFDESFVSINLGDMGLMYVFDDAAWWQCH